jgi:cell division protein FtsB
MRWRKLAAIPLLLLGLFLVFHLSRSLWDIYHRTDRVGELKNEIQKLREEKSRLEEEKAFRQTAEFIEQEARNKLQMTKEGEHVVVVPQKDTESNAKGREKTTTIPTQKPNWQKWVEFWLEL